MLVTCVQSNLYNVVVIIIIIIIIIIIVTCMSDYRRGLDRWMDLLTTYKS
jgi:cell division protein FtsW (lipid II flippase)